MSDARNEKETTGRDLGEPIFDRVIAIPVDGALDVVADIAGEVVGTVVGGVLDGI